MQLLFQCQQLAVLDQIDHPLIRIISRPDPVAPPCSFFSPSLVTLPICSSLVCSCGKLKYISPTVKNLPPSCWFLTTFMTGWENVFVSKTEWYRVAHLVGDDLLLTLNWELRFSIRRLYCDGTLNLMSTNSVPRPDGPPCIFAILLEYRIPRGSSRVQPGTRAETRVPWRATPRQSARPCTSRESPPWRSNRRGPGFRSQCCCHWSITG